MRVAVDAVFHAVSVSAISGRKQGLSLLDNFLTLRAMQPNVELYAGLKSAPIPGARRWFRILTKTNKKSREQRKAI